MLLMFLFQVSEHVCTFYGIYAPFFVLIYVWFEGNEQQQARCRQTAQTGKQYFLQQYNFFNFFPVTKPVIFADNVLKGRWHGRGRYVCWNRSSIRKDASDSDTIANNSFGTRSLKINKLAANAKLLKCLAFQLS